MIFVFFSSKDADVLAFTSDQSGSNLPLEYAPWKPAAEGGAVLASGSDVDPVTEAVRRDGFFLAVGGYEDEAWLCRKFPERTCEVSGYDWV